jgi:hypothetical protein
MCGRPSRCRQGSDRNGATDVIRRVFGRGPEDDGLNPVRWDLRLERCHCHPIERHERRGVRPFPVPDQSTRLSRLGRDFRRCRTPEMGGDLYQLDAATCMATHALPAFCPIPIRYR